MGNVLEILGGLGIFLFGLRVMSAGLQKLAGGRLRAILAGMTRNRFAGIFSGFLITCAVQSSSATVLYHKRGWKRNWIRFIYLSGHY